MPILDDEKEVRQFILIIIIINLIILYILTLSPFLQKEAAESVASPKKISKKMRLIHFISFYISFFL